MTDPKVIIAIDPGSAKTGFAILLSDKSILERKIVPTEEVEEFLQACLKRYKPDIIIMGQGTCSKMIRTRIQGTLENIPLKMVDEKHTTERARFRYFADNPPRGLWKLIPLTLQVPREPYDDYAAVIMAEDYLDNTESCDKHSE